MAADRQAPCLYLICDHICLKEVKLIVTADCQKCNNYEPIVKEHHKNKAKLRLKRKGFDEIRKEERY